MISDLPRRIWFEAEESCRIAVRQIRANGLRSFLTALGVIIGIIAVTLMGSAVRGIDVGFDQSMSPFGEDVFYVEQWPWTPSNDYWEYRNRPDIKLAFADRLNQIINSTPHSLLQLAVPSASSIHSISYGRLELGNVYTMGTTSGYSVIGSTSCKEGRFLSEAESRGGWNVCVVGLQVAESLFGSESPLGKVIQVGDYPYRVVGVFERQGSFLGLFSWDSQVVLPLASYAKYFKTSSENASIRVKVKDKTRMAEAREELVGDFRRIRGLLPEQADNFSINEQQSLRSTLGPVKAGLAVAGLFITGLALFVGAIGIMNITFVSVRERTREIGTRKALGATRRTILLQFLIEAVTICVTGGMVGLGVAFALAWVVRTAFPAFPLQFQFQLVFVALAISIVTGVFAGFAPAWQASRLSPVEALRYE